MILDFGDLYRFRSFPKHFSTLHILNDYFFYFKPWTKTSGEPSLVQTVNQCWILGSSNRLALQVDKSCDGTETVPLSSPSFSFSWVLCFLSLWLKKWLVTTKWPNNHHKDLWSPPVSICFPMSVVLIYNKLNSENI